MFIRLLIPPLFSPLFLPLSCSSFFSRKKYVVCQSSYTYAFGPEIPPRIFSDINSAQSWLNSDSPQSRVNRTHTGMRVSNFSDWARSLGTIELKAIFIGPCCSWYNLPGHFGRPQLGTLASGRT
ncbi:hypothetical protein B0H13DRAFT_2148775 [Mycena leptocephala]|nr:hypothetical protein B0H13DRAFT_2148775 [Mycena leptocephala]